MTKKIVAYKGFDKDLKCLGFQYEVGKTYKHAGDVDVCRSGFHACDNPMDVWGFYDISGGHRFGKVTQSGYIKREADKNASSILHFEAELSLGDFIQDCVRWLINHTKERKISGNHTQNASSGHYTQNASSGHNTQNASSGDHTQNASSGDYTQNASSGYSTQNASSGDNTKNASSGHNTKNASSGHNTQNASSGNHTQNASSGDYTSHECTGLASVISACGNGARIKGVAGTMFSLAKYNNEGECRGFITGKIGENGVKPNIWYTVNRGKLIMWKEYK